MLDLDILVLILININSLYIRVSLIVIDLFGKLSVLDTNAIFTRLGAEDIVNRYDKLLNEWKMLKDAEREFKLIMGLEQEKDLVKCLGSIPPGNLFKTQFYFKRYLNIYDSGEWVHAVANECCNFGIFVGWSFFLIFCLAVMYTCRAVLLVL